MVDTLHVLIPPSLARPTACFQFRLCVWLTGEERGRGEREGWQLLCRDANGREGGIETRARSSGDEGGGWRTRVNYVGKRQHFQESRTFHSVRQQPILQGGVRVQGSAVVAVGRNEKHVIPGRDAFFNRPPSSFCASNIPRHPISLS